MSSLKTACLPHVWTLETTFFAELTACQFPPFCLKTFNACRIMASIE